MARKNDHTFKPDRETWTISESHDSPEGSGLCANCHDKPFNPQLSEFMCLECHQKLQLTKTCDITGCPNTVRDNFNQMELCETHLIDSIHSEYSKYCSEKSRLQDEEQTVNDKLSAMSVDPVLDGSGPNGMSKEAEKVYTEWVTIQEQMAHNKVRKERIKDAMKSVEQPFPEQFDVTF